MPHTLSRWTLDALLPSAAPAEITRALKEFEKRVQTFEAWRRKFKPTMSVKSFLAALGDYEAMQVAGIRLMYFASLRFYADTQNQEALALMTRLESQFAEVQNRVLFFSLWWKALDNTNAKRLLKAAGDLRYWLEEMRHFKPHTLTEAEEKVINLKNVNGVSGLEKVYETLTNKFTFTLEVEGEKKTLTRDTLAVYFRSPDPKLRAAAYQELYRVYSEQAPVLAQIYGYIVNDWRSDNVGLRHFASPIAVRNLANDLPDAVVDTLLKVIAKNAKVFQRYFKLKAKWLGMEKLRRYDLYAPLSRSDKRYDYDTAVNMVLDTFQAFSPKVAEAAQSVFAANHVDSDVRQGKRGGAFCASALPNMPPYVLINYNGTANDVSTLAHEMGHAIHSVLAGGHSLLTFQASLPMAETASVFAEMLLTERLLADEKDPAVRRDVLAAALDGAYATVGRQGYFAMWEKEAHELVAQGKTPDEIAARYLTLLKQQFGDAVEVSEDFKWEWVAIPHFYNSPFYVYAYSFGQLLVLALYQMYKQEGEAFKPKYLKILSYGGSEAPIKVLKQAGIDVTSEAFWQGGYDVIARMIKDLEKLK